MNHLTYELEYLKDIFIEILNLVKNQFSKSIDALLNYDLDIAEEVIRNEKRVNAFELNIDKQCEYIIALFQPVATELRFVLAVLKSVSELERIGDHAEFISKATSERNKPFSKDLIKLFSIEEMYKLNIQMFDNIISAFLTMNSSLARKVFKIDKEINKLFKQSIKDMNNEIEKHNPYSTEILLFYAINSRLERTGDLLTNIAEEIVFYIDAEVIKHNKKKEMKKSENNSNNSNNPN